jgi:hypothetical protein
MKFQTGHTEEYIRDQFTDTHRDSVGTLRWSINDAIPFDDMLADFKSLDLIDENVQLGSNLLREQENNEFWKNYQFKQPREA